MKLLLVMIFMVASAAGLHFSEVNLLNVFKEKKASSKKISVVKPKREKVKEAPVYTFFETLNDTTMTRYVGLDGKIVPPPEQLRKISPPVISSDNKVASPPVKKTPEPVANLELKQKEKIRPTPVIAEPPRYAVQVGSFRDADRAGALKMRLQKKGFDAFSMQIQVADNAWHRVFLGRYADEQKAQEAARLAKSDYKLNAVVVSKTN
jgi:cell division protein FtsN